MKATKENTGGFSCGACHTIWLRERSAEKCCRTQRRDLMEVARDARREMERNKGKPGPALIRFLEASSEVVKRAEDAAKLPTPPE